MGKVIGLLLLAIAGLSGCMSTRKYHDIVSEKFNGSARVIPSPDTSYFVVNIAPIAGQEEPVKTEKLKSFFIPAFVYWGWESTIRSQLDPQRRARQFAADLHFFADSLKLRNRLGDDKLELTVHSLPSGFVYSRKGYVVFLLIAYVNGASEAIFPDPAQYRVTYRKQTNSPEIVTGTVTVPNHSKPLNNIWKSGRKFTWLYLDLLDDHMRKSARSTMLKVAEELGS